MVAAQANSLEVAKLLIEYDADVDIRTNGKSVRCTVKMIV